MIAFYNINIDYLKFLNTLDSEVEYSESYRTASHQKVFLGIITTVDGQKYFIPFTSAKARHKNPNVSLSSKNHMLIYEEVDTNIKRRNPHKFYRSTDDPNKFLLLISSLQFNKAIPVSDGLYTQYDITNEPDINYRNMLIKEYSFCLSRKDEIIETASRTIEAIKSGIRVPFACNLTLLESKMSDFI